MNALFFLISIAAATPVEDFDPGKVDVLAALACRLDVPDYNGFAIAVSDDEHALAAKRGWHKVASGNPFMSEYELPDPIVVAGEYRTTRIGFTASGIVAVLDQPDPGVIAAQEGIANQMDPEALIRAIVASGKVTRTEAEKAIVFRKFLGNKVLVDRKVPAADAESFGTHTVIAHEISNATTHPGKTLYGCSYRLELLDAEGKPL